VEVSISKRYYPRDMLYVGEQFEHTFFNIPSAYSSLFIEALLADKIITQTTAQQLHAIEVPKKYCSVLEYAAFYPDPVSSILENIACFFSAENPAFAIIPMYSNVSLVALLSLITLKETQKEEIKSGLSVVVEYNQTFDYKLLLKVVDVLERSSFNVVVSISSIDNTTRFLLNSANAVYIGLDVAPLMQLIRRELNIPPSQKLSLGLKYSKLLGHSNKVEWDIKPEKVKPIPAQPKKIDYLKVIFGDKADGIKEKLDFLAERSIGFRKEFVLRTLAEICKNPIEAYIKLVKYGFIKEIPTPTEVCITLTLKGLKVIK